jgi:hypothetical protein
MTMTLSAIALFGLVQVRDVADVLAQGERPFQETQAAYEGSRTPGTLAAARFKLEEARSGYALVVDGRRGGIPRHTLDGSPAPDRHESARRTRIAGSRSSLEWVPAGSDPCRSLR